MIWYLYEYTWKTWVEYTFMALQCEIDGKRVYFLPEWSQNSGSERTLQEIMLEDTRLPIPVYYREAI